jgi:two-component system phosphate regulon sensor histidine kinase PhoR
MNYAFILTIIILIVAGWYAWRYYTLRQHLNEYAKSIRQKPDENSNVKELESISSAISSLISAFNAQHSILDSERSRLATVLDQITDGVLIADAHGLIQFANPAAGKLFQFINPINHSIVEVVRHHQLVEAWRRCQQTGQMQSESVEVPTRHQFL